MYKKAPIILISALLLGGCGDNLSSSDELSNSLTPSVNSSSDVNLPKEDDKVHLVLLTGQSGARGKALNTDLTDEEKTPSADVDIVADGLMMGALNNIPEDISFPDIKPVSCGFGDTINEFGPEVGMAETLASRYPKNGKNRKSVIVKYTACGSTMISDWYTKSLTQSENSKDKLDYKQSREDANGDVWGPLTWNFFQLVDYTIDTLKEEGYEVVIDGCVFIHGEQDSKFTSNMSIYEEGLEYFIKDVRNYFNDDKMPFVITESLTNSGKYCNDLRAIQKRVSDKFENCILLTNEGLMTNTFEPWHYGKESNYELGNRIAAEIISYNDTRKVVSYDLDNIKVPKNAKIVLPKYIKANFENGYSGYVKVEFTETYDSSKLGICDIPFVVTGHHDECGNLKIEVTDEPYVDGILNEYSDSKFISLGDLGKIYVKKGKEGLYIAASINDKEVWTDGENWGRGDMGQDGQNDDFRVYVSSGDASQRITICLSAANLLRIYGDGISLSDNSLENNNWVYQKWIEEYYYRATTHGYVNDNNVKSGGVDFELFIPYHVLDIDENEINLCFEYNDIKMEGNNKVSFAHFYGAEGYSTNDNLESKDSSYININELI